RIFEDHAAGGVAPDGNRQRLEVARLKECRAPRLLGEDLDGYRHGVMGIQALSVAWRLQPVLGRRHVAGAEGAREVVPLERLGVVARHADQALVVDVAKPSGRVTAAAARGADVGLDRILPLAFAFERLRGDQRGCAARLRLLLTLPVPLERSDALALGLLRGLRLRRFAL